MVTTYQYPNCFCLCSFCFWGKYSSNRIWNYVSRNCLLGHRKKIAKFLTRTFTCRSTYPHILICACLSSLASPFTKAQSKWSQKRGRKSLLLLEVSLLPLLASPSRCQDQKEIFKDKVDYGIAIVVTAHHAAYVVLWAGTTNLCCSQLFPLVRDYKLGLSGSQE